jgi:hypothetical protein
LTHRLLKSQSKLFQFFVSVVELLLDLLELGFQANILVFGDVVSYLEISVVVLEIFFLHFHEVVE